MHLFLLIDFGTSSTKSALVDLDSGTFSAIRRHDAIPPEPAQTGRYEVSLSIGIMKGLFYCMVK